MKRRNRPWSSLCVVLLCLCSGCLGVRHTTRVIRENEQPRPVRFESEQARNLFQAGVNQMKAHKETTNFQLSFSLLGWRSQADVLSDNAVYNDEVLACDANGDGLITVQEAVAYRARVDEKIAALEAKAAEAKAKEAKAAEAKAKEAKAAEAKAAPAGSSPADTSSRPT